MSRDEREDLGALAARLTRRLIDAERPLLEAHGLSMWGYAALGALVREPAASQLALAQRIGYDKTRLIKVLDELEAQSLIARVPDPQDRRAHAVAPTALGRRRHQAAVKDIRRLEARLLGGFSATERDLLLKMLAGLGTAE